MLEHLTEAREPMLITHFGTSCRARPKEHRPGAPFLRERDVGFLTVAGCSRDAISQWFDTKETVDSGVDVAYPSSIDKGYGVHTSRPSVRGNSRKNIPAATGQHRGAATGFKRRRIVDAIQLALVLSAGTAVLSPGDAAARTCPPDKASHVTFTGSVTYTDPCNISHIGNNSEGW